MCGSSTRIYQFQPPPQTSYAEAQAQADGIVQGFGVVPASETRPKVIKGEARGRAVVAHLRAMYADNIKAFDRGQEFGASPKTMRHQANAAALGLAANVLEAAMAGDSVSVVGLLEEFVNDAIESGAVAV